MRSVRALCAALAALAIVALAGASAASAASGEQFVLATTFNGATTPDGSMETAGLVVNHATGHVLVMDQAHGAVLQFDESGNPVDFSGLGSPKLSLPSAGLIAIDNSGGPTQGNIYVLHQFASVEGFAPSGAKLGGWPVAQEPFGALVAIGVDHSGKIWFSYFNEGDSLMAQHDATGAATGVRIKSSNPGTPKEERMNAIHFAFDSHENLYYGDGNTGSPVAEVVYRRDADQTYVPRHLLADGKSRLLAIDPSTDDLYISHGTSITADRYSEEVDSSATPFETLPGLNVTGMDLAADGQTLFVSEGSKVNVFKRQPPQVPSVTEPLQFVNVKSRGTFALDSVDTGGGAPVTYAFEFASQAEWEAHPGEYGNSYPASAYVLPHTNFGPEKFSSLLSGFEPLTTYHVRVAATNVTGTGHSPDTTLMTLPGGDSGASESCQNSLPRKQTGATALPDCRAYELVSAPYAGGFDIESSMVPGQKPFAGYPSADGRVLYGVHAGIVPGPWNPTNSGIDPYVAVRGENGWTTEYVGLSAELSPDDSRFSSVLGGADADLHTFAFAGPGLCDPCFEGSPETGIPLREPNGALVQAMVGDNPPGAPNIKPEGRVAKMISADGHHLIFGSQSALVDGANNSGGNLNIFDRDLVARHTQLVSTTPGGDAIEAGMDVSELDLSANGSRVLIGTKVSDDAAGNEYAHLYMHMGTDPNSVDVTPGASAGVLYDGMTSDGSKVFFTSAQALTGEDTDSAADIYEAAVGAGGSTLTLLTPSTEESCNPVANEVGAHWNSVTATADCGAVAVGGGTGVASSTGALYLLSPEKLGGAGTLDQPNLFAISPGGASELVATLSPDDPLVIGSTHEAAASEQSEFQTTPSGAFAGFRSLLPLTGTKNAGEASVFLFHAGAPLVCPSCNPTFTEDPNLQGEASLPADGLAISDDGRLFFNTGTAISVEDTGGTKDIYEWVGGRARLISSGIGRFNSELLTVTHDGTDAFFFTHDTLDPKIDKNGERTKIYDARVGGGLFALPSSPGCRASDECHGPGTIAPPPPQIDSSGPTSDGNHGIKKGCSKGKVKKHGKCVKKAKPKKPGTKHTKKGKKHHA